LPAPVAAVPMLEQSASSSKLPETWFNAKDINSVFSNGIYGWYTRRHEGK
jgi:hypothetical protein